MGACAAMSQHPTTLSAYGTSQRLSLGAAALILTVGLWTLNFGLIDLIDGFTGFVDQSRNQMLDAGWGAIFGILLPFGLLPQLRRPRNRIAGLQQTAVVAVAIAFASLAAKEWRYGGLVAGLAVALAIVFALHPARREFLHRGGSPKPLLALMGLIAAAPCLLYAARMTSAERRHLPPSDAVTNGLHHWTAMAALALAVVLLTLLASLGTNGWRIPAWSTALAAAAWATSTLLAPDPHSAGGQGRGWAIATLAWAIAVGCIAVIEGRRESASPQLLTTTKGDRYGRATASATNRSIIYSTAGVLGVVRGLIGYSQPTYWAPTTPLDWAAVVIFSCFLAAAAASLALLAAQQGTRSRWPIYAAAAGATVAGAANALEDGFGVTAFGLPFAAGIAVMAVGLLLGGAALIVSRSGPRTLGFLLLATIAALAVAFDKLGLIVFGLTWLVIAVLPSQASR